MDPLNVAVDVELEQVRRRERGLTGCEIAAGVFEPEFGQIKGIDEGVNGAHPIVLADVVFDPRRQQSLLRARGALVCSVCS